MQAWAPDSWQQFPAQQQAHYHNNNELENVLADISQRPPLITASEVDTLRTQLAEAAAGKRFILQGGDCAESFADCDKQIIEVKLKILLQMSLVLIHGMRCPVVRIGRIAGQYAKPRSADYEEKNGESLPSYRGDLINQPEFSNSARQADPQRLSQAYYKAASTLNYIRALLDSGFADLQHPEKWDIDFVKHSAKADQFHHLVHSIQDSLAFMQTIDGIQANNLNRVDFFTSHEALHLPYEQALTQKVDGRWYNLSTHFPWIGKRTGQLDHAHVEYMRGIENPIGIKVGTDADPEWLKTIIKHLNPDNIPGRLTLITRLGAQHVEGYLADIIQTVQKTGIDVVWSCDPMHGNTQSTANGLKTRDFNDVLRDLEQSFAIHRQYNSHLAGVHFELTGENVTECIGGARGLNPEDLNHAYKSLVDPRLNYEQSLEMAMQMVGWYS